MTNQQDVPVSISKNLFLRIQSLAVPLVDDFETVISRLIDHWEKSPPKSDTESEQISSWWTSARGERIPIGTKLRAKYNGGWFKAKIIASGFFFDGEVFRSPSAAGIAAKKKNFTDLSDATASTNGWKFWEYFDEKSQSWRGLSDFKAGAK